MEPEPGIAGSAAADEALCPRDQALAAVDDGDPTRAGPGSWAFRPRTRPRWTQADCAADRMRPSPRSCFLSELMTPLSSG